MKGRNHLLVRNAPQNFLKKAIAIDTLKMFMKGRNPEVFWSTIQHSEITLRTLKYRRTGSQIYRFFEQSTHFNEMHYRRLYATYSL